MLDIPQSRGRARANPRILESQKGGRLYSEAGDVINVPLPAGGFFRAAIPKGHAPVTTLTMNVPYCGAGRGEVKEGGSVGAWTGLGYSGRKHTSPWRRGVARFSIFDFRLGGIKRA